MGQDATLEMANKYWRQGQKKRWAREQVGNENQKRSINVPRGRRESKWNGQKVKTYYGGGGFLGDCPKGKQAKGQARSSLKIIPASPKQSGP